MVPGSIDMAYDLPDVHLGIEGETRLARVTRDRFWSDLTT